MRLFQQISFLAYTLLLISCAGSKPATTEQAEPPRVAGILNVSKPNLEAIDECIKNALPKMPSLPNLSVKWRAG